MARPLAIRLTGTVAGSLQRVGLVKLDADAIVAAAIKKTGLHDFGGDGWREGLDQLLASARAEAGLSGLGTLGLRSQLTSLLVNRLMIADFHAANPVVANAPVAQPLFVLGMPRTGTTLLSNLLSMDPGTRSLRHWEANQCVPPPQVGDCEDPRVDAARKQLHQLYTMAPDFRAIHPMEACLPTECVTLLALDMRSIHFETGAFLPSYHRWLHTQSFADAYAWHRRALQVLQSRDPAVRWALKSPVHAYALDDLVATYPDARIVVTHRDPVEVVASAASLCAALHPVSSDHVDAAALGRHWADVIEWLLDRIMDHRTLRGDERFHDLAYLDLVGDPIASVRGIYDHWGIELSPLAEARMRAFLDANRQDRHGRHRYTPEQFGLRSAELRDRFAVYAARYL